MSTKKPNIIVMIVDNMPADALGCYSNTDAMSALVTQQNQIMNNGDIS